MAEEKTKEVKIKIPESTHLMLRTRCSAQGTNMQTRILKLIELDNRVDILSRVDILDRENGENGEDNNNGTSTLNITNTPNIFEALQQLQEEVSAIKNQLPTFTSTEKSTPTEQKNTESDRSETEISNNGIINSINKDNTLIDTSKTSKDNNISDNNQNQTAQSNSKNGQINSEQLSLTFPVETEKQENNKTNEPVEIENNLENPNSYLTASNVDEDNTSDAEKSVDRQVNTLLAKYPELGLHQALAKNRIGEYKKIPEEIKRAHCKAIKPTKATRLTQTEIAYRLGYAHGRNLGDLLKKNGKFERCCERRDPHKLVWEVDVSQDTSNKYFRISGKTGDSDDVGRNSQAVSNDDEKSEKLLRKQKYYNSPEKIKQYQELEILPETELKQVELAARFGHKQSTSISIKASERDLSTEDFEIWTASKDPQNIRWREFEGDKGKIYRPILSNN